VYPLQDLTPGSGFTTAKEHYSADFLNLATGLSVEQHLVLSAFMANQKNNMNKKSRYLILLMNFLVPHPLFQSHQVHLEDAAFPYISMQSQGL
jgi:hypothetical protein